MSACKHAKPHGEKGWEQPLEVVRALAALCSCAWRGKLTELLACAAENECSEALWCPQCKTTGWEYV